MHIEKILSKMLEGQTENDGTMNAVKTKKLSMFEWFLLFAKSADIAIQEAKQETSEVWAMSNFWGRNWKITLNSRQKQVLNELLEEFSRNNIAQLTTKRYVEITKTSKGTAIHDINNMLNQGVLAYIGDKKGCDVKYRIKWKKPPLNLLFTKSVDNAIQEAKQEADKVLVRSNFWGRNWKIILNLRQKQVLNELLEESSKNNTAELTTKRYIEITKTSRATAIREINNLVKKGILSYVGDKKGRHVKYCINWENPIPN